MDYEDDFKEAFRDTTRLKMFIEWVSLIWKCKDLLNDNDQTTLEMRNFLATCGMELTPEECEEYREVVYNIVHSAEWYERKLNGE